MSGPPFFLSERGLSSIEDGLFSSGRRSAQRTKRSGIRTGSLTHPPTCSKMKGVVCCWHESSCPHQCLQRTTAVVFSLDGLGGGWLNPASNAGIELDGTRRNQILSQSMQVQRWFPSPGHGMQ